MLVSTIISHDNENKSNNKFHFSRNLDLEKQINWDGLVEVIFPHYVASNISPLLLTIETMLRIYYQQKLYSMSATEMEYALHQIDEIRDFALIDLACDAIPDALCIEEFNSLFLNKSLSSEIEQAFNIKPMVKENTVGV